MQIVCKCVCLMYIVHRTKINDFLVHFVFATPHQPFSELINFLIKRILFEQVYLIVEKGIKVAKHVYGSIKCKL